MKQLRPLVGPETTLVVSERCLEGLAVESGVRRVELMGGVAYVASTVSRPGVIRRTGPLQRLIFGEFDGDRSERVEAFHSACGAGGIDAEVSDDIRLAIWEKFCSWWGCRRPWRHAPSVGPIVRTASRRSCWI